MVANGQVLYACPLLFSRTALARVRWFMEEARVVYIIDHQEPSLSAISQPSLEQRKDVCALLISSGDLELVDDMLHALRKSCRIAGMQPAHPRVRRTFPGPMRVLDREQ